MDPEAPGEMEEEEEEFDEEELDNSESDDGDEEDLCSPLIAASHLGNLTSVQSLLDEGEDKDETYKHGRTAMWYAARKGYLDIVQLLVEQGADMEMDESNYKEGTPLWIASHRGHLDLVRYLVEQGAGKNSRGGEYGDTCLGTAAYKGFLPVVSYLVEQGSDIEKGIYSPLHCASIKGRVDVVRFLLEQGANRDKANNGGYTSLHEAAINGQLETAKLLMVYGADLNARNNDGHLPIDMGGLNTEEIRQAIRDEPRRRMDEAPGKRCTEEDRHPNAATSASTQQKSEVEEIQSNKRPRLEVGGNAEEGKVAEEDEDSEPSDEEDN